MPCGSIRRTPTAASSGGGLDPDTVRLTPPGHLRRLWRGRPDDPGWKFGSRHVGVTQFVFCDGSVHLLSNSINPVTLGLLAQINDGQVIPNY